MTEQEIQNRADQIGTPFVAINEVAKIADISRTTLWRLPPDRQPKTFRMGGAQMMSAPDAVEWAVEYWAAKTEAK